MRPPPEQLTFVAEALGAWPDADRAVAWLLQLTRHESAIVREGAVYGLARLTHRQGVRNELWRLAFGDPSVGVRVAAGEALTP